MTRPFASPEAEREWERACERIAVAFANGVDRWNDAEVLALFTEDGVLDRAGQRIEGREALRNWLAGRPRDVVTRHVVSNIELSRVSESNASGLSYFTFYRAARSSDERALPFAGPSGLGEYEDRFRLTADGWKLAERKIRVVFEHV